MLIVLAFIVDSCPEILTGEELKSAKVEKGCLI